MDSYFFQKFGKLDDTGLTKCTWRIKGYQGIFSNSNTNNCKICNCLLVFIFQINAVKSLAQMLRRYTGLNHLAQAARAVLQNSSQVSQMLNDLNKVDFTNVQEQVIVLENNNQFRSILIIFDKNYWNWKSSMYLLDPL